MTCTTTPSPTSHPADPAQGRRRVVANATACHVLSNAAAYPVLPAPHAGHTQAGMYVSGPTAVRPPNMHGQACSGEPSSFHSLRGLEDESTDRSGEPPGTASSKRRRGMAT